LARAKEPKKITLETVMKELKSHANPKNVEGMARFGISPKKTLGISVPILRNMAKKAGTDHNLALKLWATGVHEARILACLVDDPNAVTERQMENWVNEFDSWDVCDQCCGSLFDKTEYAHRKAIEWANRRDEFVKRAGFAMMAVLAWHDKEAKDESFLKFLPIIVKGATDERNFVKKAVNWALRQIGKRNRALNKNAIETSKKIRLIDSKSARWIASDALRELTGAAVQKRLKS
jgi:3-methyladenine DNA glycosylase AlkD